MLTQPGFVARRRPAFAVSELPIAAQNHERPAFTLIELLVVISVIAILIGILLPALAAARKRAQQMQCLSNLHQISVSTEAYLVVFKGGYFPNHKPWGSTSTNGFEKEWYLRLAESVQFDVGFMKSPLDPYKDLKINHEGPDDGQDDDVMISYAINGYMEVAGNNNNHILKPAEVLYVGTRGDEDIEAAQADLSAAYEIHLAFHPWDESTGAFLNGTDTAGIPDWAAELQKDRYLGTANYLFVDGHAKALKATELKVEMAKPGEQFIAGEEW